MMKSRSYLLLAMALLKKTGNLVLRVVTEARLARRVVVERLLSINP